MFWKNDKILASAIEWVPPPEMLDRLLAATSLRDGLEVLARHRYWEGVRNPPKRSGGYVLSHTVGDIELWVPVPGRWARFRAWVSRRARMP